MPAGPDAEKSGGINLVAIPKEKSRHLAVRVKRPGERRSLSRSATRALDVLEAFGEARRALRAVEIARRLGLTPSTANQLLKTMVDSAHLIFDARTKTYQPSPRLAAIAAWIAETYDVGARISDLVRDVHARTGLVATVTTHNDLFMQVIDLSGPNGAGGERGLRVSLFGSAIGSAFLSTREEAEVRRLANRARVPASEVPVILEALASIRQTGHAAGPTTSDQIWSIAVPLPATVLQGQAVLGLAGPSGVLKGQLEHYRSVLTDAVAHWISAGQAPR